MLTETDTLGGGQPGLLGAVLIALAGGWAASRLLRQHLDAFRSLILGFTGAVLGLMLAGAAGWKLNGLGLLAASLICGLLVFAVSWALANAAERRRKRNHVQRREFESCGSTGRTQEDTL